MSRRIYRRPKRAVSIVLSSKKDMLIYPTQLIGSSLSTSPIRLCRPRGPGRRDARSDDRRQDQEHYYRVMQAIIDRHLEEPVISKGALRGWDPKVTEGRLVARANYQAERFGRALSELWAWLDQATVRRRVLTDQPRGLERDESQKAGWRPWEHPHGALPDGLQGPQSKPSLKELVRRRKPSKPS